MLSLCQQLPAWIRGKVTPVVQLADTHVIKPVKTKTAHKHIKLRKELQKLAETENTRAVYKCGFYEIMRTLYDVISECREDFGKERKLLQAMYSLGYLVLRPNLETNKLEKTEGQEWRKGFKLGTHRMPGTWLAQRFEHLDENGVPQPKEMVCEHGEPEDAEQSYSVEEGEKRRLAAWTEMAKSGELTMKELEALQECPVLDISLSDFVGFDGLETYAEVMKTPKQQRRERGIDVNLTSQKPDKSRMRKRKAARGMRNKLRAPLRAQALQEMKKMREEGFSVAQVASVHAVSNLGKKKVCKTKLKQSRDQIAATLAKTSIVKKSFKDVKEKLSKKAKSKGAATEEPEEEESVLSKTYLKQHVRVDYEMDEVSVQEFGRFGVCTKAPAHEE